ncbi:tetratricopeptide repeat protein 31 isoform 2-T2 [Leptodactylus fuscus]|uniref:tetratricopeptide repeat protein 31 isoform X2 n=1 Tax=Leptodactylus fuscus TaxID=238119 RepID=UPI003F4EA64F
MLPPTEAPSTVRLPLKHHPRCGSHFLPLRYHPRCGSHFLPLKHHPRCGSHFLPLRYHPRCGSHFLPLKHHPQFGSHFLPLKHHPQFGSHFLPLKHHPQFGSHFLPLKHHPRCGSHFGTIHGAATLLGSNNKASPAPDSDDSYLDEYHYYNDDDDGYNGYWDEVTLPGTYCGYRPSYTYTNYITREQADKNAEELLEEEKKEKEKADKKRLKKKRQKDRRRQQRQKEEPAEENLAPVDPTRAAESMAQDMGQEDCGEVVHEDDLDLASSFVRQAQKKMENKPKPERKERHKETLRERGRDGSQDSMGEKTEVPLEKMAATPTAAQRNGHLDEQYRVQDSMDLASVGNNLADRGRYLEALHYYTEAIRLNPGEYRFLGNRSYSYERLGRYREALQDAEKALELRPDFIKGHFRRGKALKGLKRYLEAITAFQQVLSCDLNRVEAAQEVAECQQTLQALTMSTRENLPSLQPCLPSSNNNNKVFRNVVYTRSKGGLSAPPNVPQAQQASSTLYPVWVGNITSRITEDVLRSQFSAFGVLHSLRILYSRTCAFVNFTSKGAAESAFRALQGMNIEDTTFVLQLRNPEHANLNPGGGGARQPGK